MKLLLALLLVAVVSATDREATLRGTVRAPIPNGGECRHPEVDANDHAAVCAEFDKQEAIQVEKQYKDATRTNPPPVSPTQAGGVAEPGKTKLSEHAFKVANTRLCKYVKLGGAVKSVCNVGPGKAPYVCGKGMKGMLHYGICHQTARKGSCYIDQGTCMPAADALLYAARKDIRADMVDKYGGDCSRGSNPLNRKCGAGKAEVRAAATHGLQEYDDPMGFGGR